MEDVRCMCGILPLFDLITTQDGTVEARSLINNINNTLWRSTLTKLHT